MSTVRSYAQRLRLWHLRRTDPLYAEGIRYFHKGLTAGPAELAAMQLARLRPLLGRLREAGLCQDPVYEGALTLRSLAGLQYLPILDREGLRALFPRLQQLHASRRDVITWATGGATGVAVEFMHSRAQNRLAGGLNHEAYQVFGWRPGMPRLALWGSMRELGMRDKGSRNWLNRLKRFPEYTYYFRGYRPGPPEFRRFLAAVRSHPRCAIYGLTTVLESCAYFMIEEGRTLPEGYLGALWGCCELLTDRHRELIGRAFGLPLREHYASRECTTTAVECAEGNLHIMPRYVIEVVDPQTREPLAPGQTGSLLITDLFNDVTPFIRYEIGDLGAVDWRDCACGLRGPCLTELAGRTAWLITLPSGKRITTLTFNQMSTYFPGFKQWLAVRLGPAEYEVRYTGAEASAADRERVERSLSMGLEGAEVRLVHVEELEYSPAGKLIQFRDLTGEVDTP